MQPVIDIFGAVQGRDLGAVAGDINRILHETTDVPRGSYVVMRGQVQTMTSAYSQLYFGLAGAIVLIYLVIVVNFQSWLDPFIIITALPAALAGIVWMLFTTGTTLSVPALTGAIMCMGIATANSILLVSFAREGMAQGLTPRGGARCRLHPLPPGADDGAGDDHRHAADGVCAGRRRRAECAARPRRHRRPAGRHLATLFFVPPSSPSCIRGASNERKRARRPPAATRLTAHTMATGDHPSTHDTRRCRRARAKPAPGRA